MSNPNKNLSRLYNEGAQDYADFADQSFSWKFIERPSLDRTLSTLLQADFRVLDLGCGSGRIIAYLVEHGVSEDMIVGLDQEVEMLKLARERHPKVNFVNTQAEQFQSQLAGSFDLVTAACFVGHLGEEAYSKFLANVFKYLVPGGRLLILDGHPTRNYYPNLDRYFSEGWFTITAPWGEKIQWYHRTVAAQINSIISAGFKIEKIDEPAIIAGGESQQEYERYRQFPARLTILAQKPEN